MYQRIMLSCECGRQPFKVREIGLTPERQLVIYWRCSQCRKHVYIVKSLADYWRDCPSTTPHLERKTAYGAEDALFLRRVGIRLPEEEEPSLEK
jgi:hypothetical protein